VVDTAAVAAIATLDDEVRRALFVCVRDAPKPLTREDAAAVVGVSRKLAAFHLEKLVAAGLLVARVDPRPQPRVGRTPKVYEASRTNVSVNVPQREHALLAEILLTAVREQRAGESATNAVRRVAARRGEHVGNDARERLRPGRLGVERASAICCDVLSVHGFEPVRDGGDIRLRNCPFHPLAEHETAVVCGLNHAFLSGMLRGLGADAVLCAQLDPVPGQCCVRFRPVSRER
jgi:predicted ArsR family transcriptional regulator